MPASALGKRKGPPKSFDLQSQRPAKYAKTKIEKARTILTAPIDKALHKNGDINVASFVKAREFEIKAMSASMGSSKNALSTRAFQQLPNKMRRRTASHNVKRVPKRLRMRAAKEMKDDKTPTVKSRGRAPTPHQRLRLENAKKLKQLGTLTKKKRAKAKDQKRLTKPEETDPEKIVNVTPRLPRLKKDTLSKPSKPQAKYRKRQVHKSWLPTHVWHAKRAKMTEPKNPLWRFAIPLSPTEKCFRVTHRASSLRGCVAWDTSYMGSIGLEGVEASILGLLRGLGVEEALLTGNRGGKWRSGARHWEGWIRERDGEGRWIAPVMIVWCAVEANVAMSNAEGKQPKRRLLIRVHPSAFLQVWNEALKVSKIQRPQVMIEDLRFEIGSIEITGPDAMEALIGVLHPVADEKKVVNETPLSGETQATATEQVEASRNNASISVANDESERFSISSPHEVFSLLSCITNPLSLPTTALLAFNITDPRLRHPPRTIQPSKYDEGEILNLLSTWPPDQFAASASIFDRTKRFTASRLPSQKAINRRKADAGPGVFPAPIPKDPQIPVMLLISGTPDSSCAKQRGNSGHYTLLLPWTCVQPVWYSLMHYPLSSGGIPRFGGLQEKRQTVFESQAPWFPGDFPGTRAGWVWEMMERERTKAEWARKPKGKRCEWESVDLNGKKGEVGIGWGCDWEKLFSGSSATDTEASARISENDMKTTKSTKVTTNSNAEEALSTASANEDQMAPKVPFSIHHVPSSSLTLGRPSDISPTALTPIHLTLLASGHPSRNARIYRLPSVARELRARWLTLASTLTSKRGSLKAPSSGHGHRLAPLPKNAPQYARAQRLAASLIAPQCSTIPEDKTTVLNPSDPNYPPVPDESDLIGYVTSANFQLGEGRCEAIGNVAVSRVLEIGNPEVDSGHATGKRDNRGKTTKGGGKLCIVRDAGQSIGRLATWYFI